VATLADLCPLRWEGGQRPPNHLLMGAPRRRAYQVDLADHRDTPSLSLACHRRLPLLGLAITVFPCGSIIYRLSSPSRSGSETERERRMEKRDENRMRERKGQRERGYKRTTHMPAPSKPVDEQIRRAGPCSPLSLTLSSAPHLPSASLADGGQPDPAKATFRVSCAPSVLLPC
jgi:hypothetical protein